MNPHPHQRMLPQGLVEELATRFGARFTVAEAVRQHHGKDESSHPPMLPDAVIFAESTEEVAAILSYCNVFKTPVIAGCDPTGLQ